MRPLTIALSLAFAVLPWSPAVIAHSGSGCDLIPGATCEVGNGGGGVDVGGNIQVPVEQPGTGPVGPPSGGPGGGTGGGGSGGGGTGGGSGGGTGGGDGGSGGDEPGRPDPSFPCREYPLPLSRDQEWCPIDEPAAEEPEQEQEIVIPDVIEVSDVLHFAPPTPSVSSEPKGVAIVGMPMNVVVPTEPSSSGGELFGLPVTVTFTPEQLAIDYGDGVTSTTPTNSASWESLGQAEFTPTPTSHAYAHRGRYTVSARVLSSAVVSFGPYGTVPVDGLVTSPASQTTVRAVTADTGLVDETCTENPHGPGC